jgi:farnesyl diphosphate synthase
VLEAQQFGVMGRNIHLSLGQVGGGKKLAGFEIQTYKNLIRTTVCQTNFCLPISLALYLANLSDPRIHEVAHSILIGISYFLQVTRDYVNCYVDPFGSDIKEGRITWLIIIARQRANSTQLVLILFKKLILLDNK